MGVMCLSVCLVVSLYISLSCLSLHMYLCSCVSVSLSLCVCQSVSYLPLHVSRFSPVCLSGGQALSHLSVCLHVSLLLSVSLYLFIIIFVFFFTGCRIFCTVEGIQL